MDEPFIGCIMPWALSFAPSNWAFCNGQTMQIQQNVALYSIIGTAFGGDGKTTFMLPNLNGRFPRGMGHTYADTLGAIGGSKTVTLTNANLPLHDHAVGPLSATMPTTLPVAAPTTTATIKPPAQNNLFGITGTSNTYTNSGTADTQIAGLTVTTTGALANAGGSAIFSVMPPYQAITYIICIVGYYPQRP